MKPGERQAIIMQRIGFGTFSFRRLSCRMIKVRRGKEGRNLREKIGSQEIERVSKNAKSPLERGRYAQS